MLAHSRNKQNQEHELKQHLTATGELARFFAQSIGAPDLAYFAGLFHDLGKYHPEFQEYLKGLRPYGPKHSTTGAIYASRFLDLLALVIAGHHSGLPAPSELKERLNQATEQKLAQEALASAEKDAGELLKVPDAKNLLPPFLLQPDGDVRLKTELFIRFLFSSVVDADFLDTEAHFEPERAAERGTTLYMAELWDRFSKNQAQLTGRKDGAVNRARHEIYEYCLDAASWEPGIFSLTVPTGGGKTRSAMAFALRHALIHHFKRVIVAIPYTSIIEQTADVYREIFGPEAVLEHHSAVSANEDDENSPTELRARLAAENWDAPIIVTTTVQLFESLFADKSSRCRKLHNIADSVLILDEVQTLPTDLLVPILDVLQQLVDYYHVSVVLCTATQPALAEGPLRQGFRNVREIVRDPQHYFTSLRRVSYEFPLVQETWSWEHVAKVMCEEEQVLAVVNTKKDALALLDALGAEEGLFHLSTLLCGAHRRDVLRAIRKRLADGDPCRVVSTQVVEAGVDLDFPVVLRAVGPLDRVIQAAGRCNREGRRPTGRVIIFAPEAGGMPRGAYRAGTETFVAMLGKEGGVDLSQLDVVTDYFRQLYQAAELDGFGIQELRRQLNYPEVARRFRLIADDTEQMIVRYGDIETVNGYIQAIRHGGLSRRLLRLLQPYMVAVNRHLLPQLQSEGEVAPLAPGLWEWLGGYDSLRGLTVAHHDPADLVI